MGKIRDSLSRFFAGRYGSDTLNSVLIVIYSLTFIVYTVLRIVFAVTMPESKIALPILGLIYFVLSTSLIVWIFFRMFSKNIGKRRRENEKFCGFFKLLKNKFRDRKTHVYRKCPECKAVLRLPKSKGKHTVVCPRCKKRFSVKG